MAKKKSKSKKPNITIRNHYVPQWYQKRFLNAEQTQYWYMDQTNDKEPYYNIPKNFFQQKHLYTIDLFGQKSDIIERKLFGDIDSKGSKAIDIITVKDRWQTKGGHKGWEDFMEFMNAQKLRTPKGLDWIKKILEERGFELDKIDNNTVLKVMQEIRYLYCSMWTEAIWEIVSACDSEVKFILSDNPVTFYNYQILPGSEGNRYPDEPSLLQLGTQAIYPLSIDYCLILTHRQMALEPETANPLEERINARFYDDVDNRAIFSFLDIIHSRSLNEADVHIFNYVIKKQSKRFIAASKKCWLYPEQYVDEKKWQEFYKTFLAEKEKVTVTTGIFMGHKDGSVEGYDPYGQRIKGDKELQEINNCRNMVKKITRKEKFGPELTGLLNKYDSPSVNEQNSLLIKGITDILGFKKDENLEKIRDSFDADKVKKLYYLLDDIWPVGTDIFKTLPQEDAFNLIYSGEIDFELLPWTLFNLGLYFDKVYVTNPFPAACSIQEHCNPISHPEEYLLSTYNFLISMIFLFPWIDTNQVQLVPSPFALDFKLRGMVIESAKTREESFDPMSDTSLFCRQLMRQFEQIFLITPDKALESTILRSMPGLPKEIVIELAMKVRESKKNPLVWDKSLDNIGSQMITTTIGENLESTFYLAKLTGSIPYTYMKFKKEQFESISSCPTQSIEHEIKLLNSNDGYFIKALKESGVMETVRSTLRKIKSNPHDKELHKELKDAISDSEDDWKVIKEFLEVNEDDNSMISNKKIICNIGQFDMPSIDDHLKCVYKENDLSAMEMYLSVDLLD